MIADAEADQHQALAKITVKRKSQDHAHDQHGVADSWCCKPKSRKPDNDTPNAGAKAQENRGCTSTSVSGGAVVTSPACHCTTCATAIDYQSSWTSESAVTL